MKIRITETNVQWVNDFTAMLATQYAGINLGTSIWQVADSFPVNAFHGVALWTASNEANGMAPEYNWIKSYTGSNDFYKSLQNQLTAKGVLSEKQWAYVVKAMTPCKPSGNAPVITPVGATPVAREYSIKAGQLLVLRKFAALRLSEQLGRKVKHHTFEVLEVLAETPKAYKVKVKFSAAKTSYCGICGLTLTDSHSVQYGIGPICAEKNSFPYGITSLLALEHSFENVSGETWIAKSGIKDKLDNIQKGE